MQRIHQSSFFALMVMTAMLFISLHLLRMTASADAIDDYVKAQKVKNHIPGLAYTVIKDGKTIKSGKFGLANLEWKQPVAGNTVFQLASSTKLVTGILLMMLVEEGRLMLEDLVTKYLPDAPANWRIITIRHLATHASGINGRVEVSPTASIDEYVKAAYALPFSYQPGEKAVYGFNDFVVLTDIIEKITCQDFVSALQERVLGRLQMNETAFDLAADSNGIRSANMIKNRADIYQWENDRNRHFQFLFPERGYSAGGLLTSINDLSKLFIALDSGKLLSAKSLDQMWQRDRLADGSFNSFGVGWVVGNYNNQKIAGHSGGDRHYLIFCTFPIQN